MDEVRLRKLAVPIGVNALLGIPALVPIHLIWYILANGPLADLGWTQRSWSWNPNDGLLPLVIIAALVLVVFGAIWGGANAFLRRRTDLPAAQYWLICSAATLVPLCVDAVR
ncbi:hypothetical protein ACTOB_008112 [Actinoplanes oblitus]|uniref:Uncharacterized protein n=1 Tax=Actinoplanes oblitus TaxID=3040509 RepID=A0ABY8WDM0_9ACTN|nr:hypothetical protein [Actinoplanes oblitus]WIM95966.1 hypothetical protein ACTOB_008112 [Actinoplanes oblitus]